MSQRASGVGLQNAGSCHCLSGLQLVWRSFLAALVHNAARACAAASATELGRFLFPRRKRGPGLEVLKHDRATGGGASLSTVCEFLSVWEVLFIVQPVAKGCAQATRSSLCETGRQLLMAPDDLAMLRAVLKLCRGNLKGEPEVTYVRRLLQAVPGKVTALSLPFGVPDMELRAWVQSGLLQDVEELHLLGRGGPSDLGLARLVTRCPRLRSLTLLSGAVSAAATLVLHAEVGGSLTPEWWSNADSSKLRVLPRLQEAAQARLTLQRVPSWLVGRWSPTVPGWGHEVHHFDPLGRFVFLRNGAVERVGVVRSCLPSPYGLWWELDLCFFVNQEWVNQMNLMLPVGPNTEADEGLQAWGGSAEEPAGVARVAVIGSSVRQHPRQFPHYGLSVTEWRRWSRESSLEEFFPWSQQEWAEAALASCNGDMSMVFDRAESSDEEEEQPPPPAVPSMEELLAKLDRDEALELVGDRPSLRSELEGTVASVEELLAQLDREDEVEGLMAQPSEVAGPSEAVRP